MKTDSNDLIVVCGAGGFIGGHLVADLLRQGHSRIRAVDVKPAGEWYQRFPQVENPQTHGTSHWTFTLSRKLGLT